MAWGLLHAGYHSWMVQPEPKMQQHTEQQYDWHMEQCDVALPAQAPTSANISLHTLLGYARLLYTFLHWWGTSSTTSSGHYTGTTAAHTRVIMMLTCVCTVCWLCLQGVYFLGKVLWAKGYTELLERLQEHSTATGQNVEVDVYGSGPDLPAVQEAARNSNLRLKFNGPKDHADSSLQVCTHEWLWGRDALAVALPLFAFP